MSVFAIDIGGTKIKSAVVEEGLTFKICQTINTKKDDLEALLNSIEKLWKENGKDCEGIAICLPGIIDDYKIDYLRHSDRSDLAVKGTDVQTLRFCVC